MRPIVDTCFKELMRNPAVRSGFAAAIMNCRPEEVVETYLMPTYLQNGKEEEKQGILDVRVLLKKGTADERRSLWEASEVHSRQYFGFHTFSGGSRVLPENTFQGRKDREAVFR